MSYTTIHSEISILTQVIEQKAGTRHINGELIEEITDIWLPIFRSKECLVNSIVAVRIALEGEVAACLLCDEYLSALDGMAL